MTDKIQLPKLFTQDQVAAMLGLHPETVARERRRKRLGYIHVGRNIRIREDQLAAYLNRGEGCASTSETTLRTGQAPSTSAGPTGLDADTAHQLAREIWKPPRRSSPDSSSTTIRRGPSGRSS